MGGRVTGPVFQLHDWSALLFVLSAVMIGFQRRVAYAIALAACAASLPLQLFAIVPGRFLGMFRGELHGHYPDFAWAPWALAGIVASAAMAYLILRDWNRKPLASIR
jgi:hypothetical protein